jgi:hypothetical protein
VLSATHPPGYLDEPDIDVIEATVQETWGGYIHAADGSVVGEAIPGPVTWRYRIEPCNLPRVITAAERV